MPRRHWQVLCISDSSRGWDRKLRLAIDSVTPLRHIGLSQCIVTIGSPSHSPAASYSIKRLDTKSAQSLETTRLTGCKETTVKVPIPSIAHLICCFLGIATPSLPFETVQKKLDDAKALYAREMREYKKEIDDWFEVEIDFARKAKSDVAAKVKKVKAEKEEFDTNGTLPKRFPNTKRRKQTRSLEVLVDVYKTTIDSYYRDKKDEEATKLEKELGEIQNRNVLQSIEVGGGRVFNGRNLTGFLPGLGPNNWVVDNGFLGNQGNGSIFTAKTYSDFVLNFEFQITADTAATIDIGAFPGDTPAWVFIENTRNAMGAITRSSGEGKAFNVSRLDPPADLRPPGRWNEMTIEFKDSTLQVTLNGKQLDKQNLKDHFDQQRVKLPPEQRRLGRIGLSKRWGTGTILLRNLVVEELQLERFTLAYNEDFLF
ncbi:hypothetical protein FGO68_gene8778 [Halteria grandinella]|uniref:3-keto-alpha-glucoside-1,2-lyase/3-keto-2-hydroxy-glucal hydratase domain-containing protein n=1 Tax=Halteria grandinella TaxID=5974 RepID=A0A8J8NAU9_HALGN|nr:hypothetical protein FGO68_gene8778 [Halteria grandinella]